MINKLPESKLNASQLPGLYTGVGSLGAHVRSIRTPILGMISALLMIATSNHSLGCQVTQESQNSLRSDLKSTSQGSTESRIARRIQTIQRLSESNGNDPLEMTAPSTFQDVDSNSTASKRPVQIDSDDPKEWRHVKAIHNRIDSLKAILDKQNMDARKAKANKIKLDNLIAAMKAETAAKALAAKQATAAELPPVTPTDQPPTNPTPSAADQVPDVLPSESPDTPIDSAKGVQVISTPVNSFELANSLLATKNYKQALKSYHALLKEDNSLHDENWIRCMMANCFRMLGDNPKAEALYRDVLESKEKSHTVVYAKWFLDHLTQRRNLNEQLQILENELQANTSESSQ
jgi:hypothetical protein